MSRLSLYLLGPPRIECNGAPIKVDTRKAIALIAYLAITGERHGRDALVNLLWPEYDQTRGRAALRRTLYALRKSLSDLAPGSEQATWLDVDRESIGLAPNARLRKRHQSWSESPLITVRHHLLPPPAFFSLRR